MSPKPRYRFYGSPRTYLTALQHVVSRPGHNESATAELEAAVCDMTGATYAACMPQARFGLYLAIKALIQPGQSVVMSPYTIYDVVNMVLAAGGKPVWADIEADTCNIDPAQIEQLIDERTGAVMVTHLHGLACDMERVRAICAAHKVPIIEDAAQAFGARIGGDWVGTLGDVGVYSFGRAKNINAFYGGMLVTRRDDVHRSVSEALAELPYEDASRLVKRIGHCLAGDVMTFPALFSPLTFSVFRYAALNDVQSVNKVVQTENEPERRKQVPEHYFRRMTPLQARVAIEQLAQVDSNTAVRLEYAERYHEGLADLQGVSLPPLRRDGSHIYLQFPIQVEERWDLVRHMMKHGRDVAIQHMNSAAELEPFRDLRRDCPVARKVAQSVVLLPTYPRYGMSEVDRNVAVIRDYFGKSS